MMRFRELSIYYPGWIGLKYSLGKMPDEASLKSLFQLLVKDN